MRSCQCALRVKGPRVNELSEENMSVKEIGAGVHFAYKDSKMTELPNGVFIRYEAHLSDRMKALKELLIKYYHADQDRDNFPFLFADRIPLTEILAHSRKLKEKPSDFEASFQDED